MFCCASLATISGCRYNYYKYKDQNYRSPEEALNALQYDLCQVKSRINPTRKYRGGSVAVVIPSFETFIALGVKSTGLPNQEQIYYMGKFLVTTISATALFVEQRKIFEKVTLIEDKHPLPAVEKMITKYDAVIYFDLVSPQQYQWFIRARPEYVNMPINTDQSKTVGYPRTLSWLKEVEKRLDESGYAPRR